MDQLPEDLTTDRAIELLLAAIAYEQFALGNIIDAEADKIDHVVSLNERGLITLDEVREVSNSTFKVLKTVIKKEMLLEFELEDLIDFIPRTSTSSTTSTTTTISTTTTTSTSTTTSRTCTSFTTTKDRSCNWHFFVKIMILLIFLAIHNKDNEDCYNQDNCEEDYCHKNSYCKKDY